jgi:Zn-dependent protease
LGQWWVSSVLSGPNGQIMLFSWVVWVIGSIILHELAHGWAAIRKGDRTPIELGHMTWNPVVHIPPMSLLMFGLFGFCWGLMPVDPSRMRGRYAHAYVAFAGPLCNIIQFTVLVIASIAFIRLGGAVPQPLQGNIEMFLWVGAMINAMGALFNLIPVPPLDGSTIASEFSRAYRNFMRTENGAIVSLIAFALLMIGLGGYVWGAAAAVTSMAIGLGLSATGAPVP